MDKDFNKWLEEQGIDEEHNPLPEDIEPTTK